jgi:hypothetical protein
MMHPAVPESLGLTEPHPERQSLGEGEPAQQAAHQQRYGPHTQCQPLAQWTSRPPQAAGWIGE